MDRKRNSRSLLYASPRSGTVFHSLRTYGVKRKLHSLQLFLSTDGIGWIVALAYLGSISFRRI